MGLFFLLKKESKSEKRRDIFKLINIPYIKLFDPVSLMEVV